MVVTTSFLSILTATDVGANLTTMSLAGYKQFYSGGSNTERVRISNGRKLFECVMVVTIHH